MPQLTLGDLTRSALFGHRNATLKDSITTLSTEVTTGLTANTTAAIRGDYSALTGIAASLTQLASFKLVTSESAARAGHMQLVLGNLADSGTALSNTLLAAADSTSPTQVNVVAADADQRLQGALSALNTRLGATSLFAGTATDSPAVVGADTMLTALQTAITGALSAQDVIGAVDAWFADPAGYQATVYQGGDAQGGVDVSPDQRVQLGVTAKDPAITATLKAMATAALLQRGVLAGDQVSRADLARRAGQALASATAPLIELSARLGTTEATIASADIRNDAERSALETARLGLLSIDPYDAAARLQQAQSQLETLYSVTARLSRLSLVNYL